MGKIARKIDPDAEMDLPDKPPGMHWSRYNRLAERFEHQSNVWTIATMRRLGVFLPRLRRGSKGDWLKIWRNCGRSPVFSPRTNPMDYSANAWRTPA